MARSAELIDAAGAVVYELGRVGVALPLRQTLIARAAARDPIATAEIVVDAHAHGVWAPVATMYVDAAGIAHRRMPQPAANCDIAGRPVIRHDDVVSPIGQAPIGVLAQFLLVQEIAGAARGAIEQSRQYVSSRIQFGRALSTLPAVAQQLGQLTITQLQLDEAVRLFGYRLRVGSENRTRFAATAARTLARDVAGTTATQAHQLHGALGITQEATLRHRTVLLWADQDEGLSARTWGVQTLPDSEIDLWTYTDPRR